MGYHEAVLLDESIVAFLSNLTESMLMSLLAVAVIPNPYYKN